MKILYGTKTNKYNLLKNSLMKIYLTMITCSSAKCRHFILVLGKKSRKILADTHGVHGNKKICKIYGALPGS